MSDTYLLSTTATPAPNGTAALDQLSSSFEWISPDLATEWLSLNANNRRPKPRKVAAYARDMRAGHWRITGEAIKFGTDLRLLDGQNRLMAVVDSDTPIVSLVVRGLDPASQVAMDSGVARTAADALQMDGTAAPVVAASVARLALSWQAGKIPTALSSNLLSVTSSEVAEFVHSDPFIGRAVELGRAHRIGASPSATGFAAWLLLPIDPVGTVAFFSDLAQYRTNGKGDPRYTLLNRLSIARASREAPSAVTLAYYVVRAWNAHRSGHSLYTLKTGTKAGSYPFPRPV